MHKIAIFSHDSYGLGHLRRCMLIAEAAVSASQSLDCLIITGSPRALAFKLPERVDAIKIPSITKSTEGHYTSRKLLRSRAQILDFRAAVAGQALETYDPDVVLVDHAPAGANGELLPELNRLHRSPHRPRLILGLRDIVDAPSLVERQWSRGGIWDALDLYDEVLVYGDATIRTTADELNLASRLCVPVTKTGYVAPQMPEPAPGDPFLLVTAGGGGDGHQMIRQVLDLVEANDIEMPVRIVTGPLLSKARQAEFINRADRLGSVHLTDFTTELRHWIASATAMISMAGYNTTVEALAAGTPTLLVPRSDFRQEQRLRAERVSAQVAHVHSIPSPASLSAAVVKKLLGQVKNTAPPPINLGGAHQVAHHLLKKRASYPSPTRPLPIKVGA